MMEAPAYNSSGEASASAGYGREQVVRRIIAHPVPKE